VSDAGDKTPIEQAVEHAFDLFVYAPIGLLFEGASLLPELVAKGKSQVAMARVIGTFAVDKASSTVGDLSSKLQDQTAGVIDFIGDSITPVAPDLPDPEPPPRLVHCHTPPSRARSACAPAPDNQASNVALVRRPDHQPVPLKSSPITVVALAPVSHSLTTPGNNP